MRLRLVVADIDIRVEADTLDQCMTATLQLLGAAAAIERTEEEPDERAPLGFTITSELDPHRHDRNLGEPDWDEEAP